MPVVVHACHPSGESPVQSFLRLVSHAMMALVSVLIVLGGLQAARELVFKYSWVFRAPVAFHEGWTPEERAALVSFDQAIRFHPSRLAEAYGAWEEDWDAQMAVYGRELGDRLREVALSSGYEDLDGGATYSRFGTLAMVAASLGEYEAMRALIGRGCPMEVKTKEGETVLSLALKAPVNREESLRTADWLARQGAKVTGSRPFYSLLDRDLALSEWLISQGLPVGNGEVGSGAILSDVNLPLLERLVQDGSIQICQPMVEGYPIEESCRRGSLGVVRFLLQLGADPNQFAATRSPLWNVLQTCGDERSLALVRQLLLHGAQAEPVPSSLPDETKRKLKGIYTSYGYSYSEFKLEPDHE